MTSPKSITEVPMKCICGWTGTVIDCDSDDDYPLAKQEGKLRCPDCGYIVKQSENQEV